MIKKKNNNFDMPQLDFLFQEIHQTKKQNILMGIFEKNRQIYFLKI